MAKDTDAAATSNDGLGTTTTDLIGFTASTTGAKATSFKKKSSGDRSSRRRHSRRKKQKHELNSIFKSYVTLVYKAQTTSKHPKGPFYSIGTISMTHKMAWNCFLLVLIVALLFLPYLLAETSPTGDGNLTAFRYKDSLGSMNAGFCYNGMPRSTNQTLLDARGVPFLQQACEDTNRTFLLRNKSRKNTSFSATFDQVAGCDDGEGADGEGDYLLSQQDIIHVEASSSSFGGRIDPPVLHDGQIAGIQERPPPWSMNDTAICAQQKWEKAARQRDEWFSPFPFRRWLAILRARLNHEGALYRASVWSLFEIAVNSFGFIKNGEFTGVFEYTINPLTFIRPPETRIDDSLLQEAIIACTTTTTTTRIPHEALMEGDSGIHPTRMASVRNRNVSVRERMQNAVL